MENITHYYQEIYQELIIHLDEIFQKDESDFIQLKKAIISCKEALDKVDQQLLKYAFSTQDEEIYFFKYQKPELAGKLIFYVTLLELKESRPNSIKKEHRFLIKKQKEIYRYLKKHHDYWHYYITDESIYDNCYYIRSQSHYKIFADCICCNYNKKTTTSHSHLLGILKGYGEIINYLEKEIDKINVSIKAKTEFKTDFTWTDNKSGIIELVYALKEKGSVNNGKVNIKDLIVLFESIFNVKIKDPYNKYKEIKTRKSEIFFLDNLKEGLVRKIEKDL